MRRWSVLIVGFVLAGCGGRPLCALPVFDAEGHRGARAARPENTLPAMEYAISRGVRTLEMDLAVTKDDVVILSHDPWLLPERCLGPDGQPAPKTAIRDLTYVEITRHDCGSQRHKDFTGQVAMRAAPPTLSEVLALGERLGGGTLHYNMEPKMDPATDHITPTPERFIELVEKVIDQAGVADRVIIESFDARPLRVLLERRSTVRRAFLFPTDQPRIVGTVLAGDPLETAAAVDADILAPLHDMVTRPMVDAAHARGLSVIPWTVNNEQRMKELMDMGVDGIISDEVDMLVRAVRDHAPQGGLCWRR